MFEILILRQRPFFNKQERQGTNEHGADAEAEGDDEQVVRQSKRTDDTVEREARIQQLEVQETSKAGTNHLAGMIFRFEQRADCFGADERHDAPEAGDEERVGVFSEERCSEQGDHGCECDLDVVDLAEEHERLFQERNPVMFLVDVEEELESDHEQEGAAESCDRFVSRRQNPSVFIRLLDCQSDGRDRTEVGSDADDQEREHNAHAEHSDDHAPCQESMTPQRIHAGQFLAVDDCVVERQGRFENAEDSNDNHRFDAADEVGENEREGREDHRALEELQKRFHDINPFWVLRRRRGGCVKQPPSHS